MTNADLDRRILECAAVVGEVVDDLASADPTIERAVALGVLSVCLNALHMLGTQRAIERVASTEGVT